MTLIDIKTVFEQTGIPTVFGAWPTGHVPTLPYLVWLTPYNNNFAADNKVYYLAVHIRLELYTAQKSTRDEETVENALNAAGLFWTKEQIPMPEEDCWLTAYEMEI